MGGLSVEVASVATSVADVCAPTALRVALALALGGILVNTIAGLASKLDRPHSRYLTVVRLTFIVVGVSLPIMAVVALFVGTQPIPVTIVAGATGLLMLVGLLVVTVTSKRYVVSTRLHSTD